MSCDLCGEVAMAVAPGSEDEAAPGAFRVKRGERARAWCFRCWCRVFKLDEATA